jgi:hypothetical protein
MSTVAAGAEAAAGVLVGTPVEEVALDEAQPAVCSPAASESEASGNAIHRAPDRRCHDSNVMSGTPF